jgi:GT2 family glycosyltransferase
MKHLGIIVLHFNNKAETDACVSSLQQLLVPEHCRVSIVLVDNGSEHRYPSVENKGKLSLTLLRNTENKGYAGGMNTGLSYMLEQGWDYGIVLNNDTIVDPSLVLNLLDCIEKYPDAGIVAPKIYFAKGSEYHKQRYKPHELGKVIWYAGGFMDWNNVIGHHRGVDEVDVGQFDKTEETEFASGCCFLLTRKLIEKIGMFDERYFLYYEDSDLNMRAKKNGFGIFYEPKAIIFHKNASSSGGSGSSLQDYFITRNRLLFGISYASYRAKLALYREAFSLLISGRDAQKKGVWDFFIRRFGKGSS